MNKIIFVLVVISLGLSNRVFAESEPTEKLDLPKCSKLKLKRFWSGCIGEKKLTDSIFYEGPFFDGKPHGYGFLKYENGNSYEGDLQNGRLWGQGVWRYNDGAVISGEFRDGVPIEGALTYADGSTYVGAFNRNWERDGDGKTVSVDGWTFDGTWKDGGPTYGSLTLKNGEAWLGKLNQKDWTSIEEGVGRRIDGSSDPAKLKSTYDEMTKKRSFEIVWSFNSSGCEDVLVNNDAGSLESNGLPRSVGPIRLGMSVREFECVAGRKLLPCDHPDESIFGKNNDFPACGGLQVLTLHNNGNAVLRNSELGKEYVAITGYMNKQAEGIKKLSADFLSSGLGLASMFSSFNAIFYNDSLFLISIPEPAVGVEYLEKKYGRAKFNVVSKSVTCRDSAGFRQDLNFFDNKWVWRGGETLVVYANEEKLDEQASCTPLKGTTYVINDGVLHSQYIKDLNTYRDGLPREEDDLGF